MNNLARKLDSTDIPDGTYVVESIYPVKKDLSKQTIKVVNGRVHQEKTSYTLSVGDFFHDHKIVNSVK